MPVLRKSKKDARKRRGPIVGIDDLSVYVPALVLPLEGEFSRNRGIDPGKLIKGIGIECMAVPDAHEDAASMAAMALLDLMRRNSLLPEQIGKIYVGTESSVDEAKAIGTYVIGMMEQLYGKGSFQECSTVEFKAACIGTTFALESLSHWLSCQDEDDDSVVNDFKVDDSERDDSEGCDHVSDDSEDYDHVGDDYDDHGHHSYQDHRIGIVIASDVARYPLNSSGEYTQGAGSVALLLKRNPRLLALEQIYGSFTRDENDFFRPTGCKTAVVNGKHSNQCYLDAMIGAFDSFARQAMRRGRIKPGPGRCPSDFIDHFLFHIPYPRMVEYASAALFRHDWSRSRCSCWRDVQAEIGAEPVPEDYSDSEAFRAAQTAYSRSFARSSVFQMEFRARVADAAMLSRRIGNIYTGSIYLGLASLLELGALKCGERLGFGAYGSGCSALFFSAIVQAQAESVQRPGLIKRLEGRRRITLEEYERLHEGRMQESIIQPHDEFALRSIDEQGYRHYEFAK